MNAPRAVTLGLLGLALPTMAEAQDLEPPPPPVWFVRLSPRVLFNVRASISPLRTPVEPGIYDDGFVLPDVAGPGALSTWNWGYDNGAQVASGTHLLLNRLTGAPELGVHEDRTADPMFGGELVAGAELNRFNLGRKEARIGVEMGYAYHSFSLGQRESVTSMALLEQDTYALNGITPPTAPYAGTFQGPGPLISSTTDSHTEILSSATGTYRGELNSDLHHFKAGLWFEYPITERLLTGFSFGYSALYADSQLRFTQQVDFVDPGIPDQPANSHTVGGRDWNPGFYAQLRLGYDFTEHFAAFLGGEFEYNESYSFHGEGRQVDLDFGGIFAVTAGLVFRF